MIPYPSASVFPPLPVGGTPLSDLQKEVIALKKAKDAIILAHNYQCEDIQNVADFVGDSLGLAYKAAEAKQSTIVFCGVHFMAETAKIVNPTRRVLLPDMNAGCSLADSCPASKLAAAESRGPFALRRRVHQLQRRGESAQRCHRHQRQRLEDRQPRTR